MINIEVARNVVNIHEKETIFERKRICSVTIRNEDAGERKRTSLSELHAKIAIFTI